MDAEAEAGFLLREFSFRYNVWLPAAAASLF